MSALFLMVKAGLGGAFIPSFMESELPEGLALLPQKILPARAYCSMILASSPNPPPACSPAAFSPPAPS